MNLSQRFSRSLVIFAAAIIFAASHSSVSAQSLTFTVNSTGDGGDFNLGDSLCQTAVPGECTLRAAIQQANVSLDADTIEFSIAGAGVHTISPVSPLPNITRPVLIDGYTQPGSSPNTLAVGDNAVLLIELSGASAGNANGLFITGGNSTVKGLVVNRFSDTAIHMQTNGGNTVSGNFININPAGDTAAGGTFGTGIGVANVGNNLVGGSAPGQRNVVGGSFDGIVISSSNGANNTVQGNYVGTDRTGMVSLTNRDAGILVASGAHDNLIGGDSATGAGNLISGNGNVGVSISTANANIIRGNLIGTNATGTGVLGNSGEGVYIINSNQTQVGGLAPGDGNVIANHGFRGVNVRSGVGNSILGNSIYSNTLLGIDLSDNGITPNDPLDTDAGANNQQNFPVLTAALPVGGGSTRVVGNFNSNPSTSFRLEFFNSPTAHPSGFGEGKTYVGTINVTTDASGDASFDQTFSFNSPSGSFITSTATRLDAGGNPVETSEFSNARQVIPPTAASVCLGGMVMNENGSGVSQVRVTLTESDGTARTSITGAFGYYNFCGIQAGQIVILTVSSKRYYFQPDTVAVNVMDAIDNLNFTALLEKSSF